MARGYGGLQGQLERWVRLNPRMRWPVIGVLVLVAAVLVRLDRSPPRTSGIPAGPGAGRADVKDGDSLRIGGEEIRLKDIDAPEGRQTCTRAGRDWDCGEEARRELQRRGGRAAVACRSVERDKHRRLLGYCEADGRELNRAMVESGMAVAYGGYRAEERAAKAARRGLWSGEFQLPRDWRHERGIGQ